MYVCVCNEIRCRDVKALANDGKQRAADVFRHFDARPRCGKCVAMIGELLDADRKLSSANDTDTDNLRTA